MRHKRLVLSPFRLWLMNQPFRVLGAAARGFGPGSGNVLRTWTWVLRDTLLDSDRMRWCLARALNLRPGRGRDQRKLAKSLQTSQIPR